jgi:hypothetical protein
VVTSVAVDILRLSVHHQPAKGVSQVVSETVDVVNQIHIPFGLAIKSHWVIG